MNQSKLSAAQEGAANIKPYNGLILAKKKNDNFNFSCPGNFKNGMIQGFLKNFRPDTSVTRPRN